MLEQLGWILLQFAGLVGFTCLDLAMGSMLFDVMKRREWLLVMAFSSLFLFSSSMTILLLGRIIGW